VVSNGAHRRRPDASTHPLYRRRYRLPQAMRSARGPVLNRPSRGRMVGSGARSGIMNSTAARIRRQGST
jgi:hypothetical protein